MRIYRRTTNLPVMTMMYSVLRICTKYLALPLSPVKPHPLSTLSYINLIQSVDVIHSYACL